MRVHCTADAKRKPVPKFRELPSFVHGQHVCTSMSYRQTAHTIGFLGILKCFRRAEGKENKESNILGRIVHIKVLGNEKRNVIHSGVKINKEYPGYRHSRHGVLRQAIRQRKGPKRSDPRATGSY